jgi:hypothetical protein
MNFVDADDCSGVEFFDTYQTELELYKAWALEVNWEQDLDDNEQEDIDWWLEQLPVDIHNTIYSYSYGSDDSVSEWGLDAYDFEGCQLCSGHAGCDCWDRDKD